MASAMMMSTSLAPSAAFVGAGSGASRQLRAFGLPQMRARRQGASFNRLVVRAQDNTPLPGTKVDVTEKKDEPLRIFDDTPAGKFARPESERRPEFGNTDFVSVMKFDGPAPETINGRLAMLGITWAFIAENLTGTTIAEQVAGGTGLIWFLIAVPLFIWASLAPIFGWNESPDSRAFGPFNAQAERWNGRIAMIAFASTLIVENLIVHGPILAYLR